MSLSAVFILPSTGVPLTPLILPCVDMFLSVNELDMKKKKVEL